jgi:hypothetical protein
VCGANEIREWGSAGVRAGIWTGTLRLSSRKSNTATYGDSICYVSISFCKISSHHVRTESLCFLVLNILKSGGITPRIHISVLGWGEWSASRSCCFISWRAGPCYLFWKLCGPKGRSWRCLRSEIQLVLLPETKLSTPVVRPVSIAVLACSWLCRRMGGVMECL